MESTVQKFFDEVSEGKSIFETPKGMQLDINGNPVFMLERIHETGFRYLIVPKGHPQQNMYWRSAMPHHVLTIFEEPIKPIVKKEEPKVSKPTTPKKTTTTKAEKK